MLKPPEGYRIVRPTASTVAPPQPERRAPSVSTPSPPPGFTVLRRPSLGDTKPSVAPARNSVVGDVAREVAGAFTTATGSGLRGFGETARTLARPIVAGVNAAAGSEVLPQPVNPFTRPAAFLERSGQAIQASESPEFRQAIEDSTPEGDIFKGEFNLGRDPSVLGYVGQAANLVGQIAPTAAAAIATRGGSLVRQLGGSAAISAAQGGGAAAQQEGERVRSMPEDQLAQVPAYAEAIAHGVDPTTARETLAAQTEQSAFTRTAPVSAVSGLLIGGGFSRPAQSLLTRAVGTRMIPRVATAAGVEGLGEGAQEVAEQAAQTHGANVATGEDRSLTEGSAASFALGALGGGLAGGTAAVVERPPGPLTRAAQNVPPAAAPAPESATEGPAPRSKDRPKVTAAEITARAQRALADIEAKARGTEDRVIVDADGNAQTVPGTPPQVLTDSEREMLAFLHRNIDKPEELAKRAKSELVAEPEPAQTATDDDVRATGGDGDPGTAPAAEAQAPEVAPDLFPGTPPGIQNPPPAPGSLADAASAIAPVPAPAGEPAAASPADQAPPASPPAVPWFDAETGEIREPTDDEVKDQFHRLFDAARASGASVRTTAATQRRAAEWGIDLDRMRRLRTEAQAERKAGFKVGDQRPGTGASGTETAPASRPVREASEPATPAPATAPQGSPVAVVPAGKDQAAAATPSAEDTPTNEPEPAPDEPRPTETGNPPAVQPQPATEHPPATLPPDASGQSASGVETQPDADDEAAPPASEPDAAPVPPTAPPESAGVPAAEGEAVGELPDGWIESTPDGNATKPGPEGGTVELDQETGKWKVISNRNRNQVRGGLPTRAAAIEEVRRANPRIVTVTDVRGDTHRVDAAELAGARERLLLYNADGTPKPSNSRGGRFLHRENIDTSDGQKIAEMYAADKLIAREPRGTDHPLPYKNAIAVEREIKRRRQNPDDFEIKAVPGGFVGVRKAPATTEESSVVEASTPAIEPIGKKGLLVRGDAETVRATLQAAGFRKKGRKVADGLRFDAADRPAIEAAMVAAPAAETAQGTEAEQTAPQRIESATEDAPQAVPEKIKDEPTDDEQSSTDPAAPADPFSDNKIFTADKVAAARARLRSKLGNLNSGLDPELLVDGMTIAGAYIESGVRKFGDYASAMIGDLGDAVKPYLLAFYEAARNYPGIDRAGMDSVGDAAAAHEALMAPVAQGENRPETRDNAATENEDAEGDQQGVPDPDQPGIQGAASGRERPAQRRPASQDSDELATGQPGDVATPATGGTGAETGLRSPGADVAREGRARKGRNGRDGRARAGRAKQPDAGTGVDSAGSAGQPETSVETVKDPATVSPANPGPGNFHIENPLEIVGGGQVARFNKNKAAIEKYVELRDEGRMPTREEQEILAGYTGWGSFGQDLFQGTWERPQPKAGWEDRDQWLRDHLGQAEWEGMQRSITNAHYTDPPTVLAMWDMVRRMGFQGGRVLEPSMGIGNFFGMMPTDLAARSTLAGIELDPMTGHIAKMLYPDANVRVMGYQESKTPDDFYDLVIGNWPFENTPVADRRYNRLNPMLHDYFFLKTLDQVRPGGIVIGITSAGSMDKKGKLIRREMAKKAELVASFRLPSGAFEQYAGTKVVTDIVILRKRPEPITNVDGEAWIETVDLPTDSGTDVHVNAYYQQNPQNVVGKIDFGHGTTTFRAGMIVHRPADMEAELARITAMVPEGAFQPRARPDSVRYIANHTSDREGALTRTDAGLFIVRGEQLAPANEVVKYRVKSENQTAEREAQLDALIGLRQEYGRLIEAERGAEGVDPEPIRKRLRAAYNQFTKAHGTLSDSFGLKYLSRIDDPFYPALAALETVVDGKVRPATILERSTTRSAKRIEKPTITDAFILARNSATNPSAEAIAAIAGKPVAEVQAELVKAGAVFETPGGDIVPTDIYLSGNVREKLRQAEAAVADGNTAIQRNVDALKKVLPADIPYFNIEVQMGASWVPTHVYEQFIAHMLNRPSSEGIAVTYTAGRWIARIEPRLQHVTEASTGFGTPHYRFGKLVNAAIGNQTVTVKKRDSDGTEYVDREATDEANAKIAEMREKFGEWLWADAERRTELEREYNEVRNAYADPQFDGSFLNFEGMALSLGRGPFDLRQHQANAIWRGLVMRRSLNAHEVGTGKTFTMGGIAVESRRYGIARKPLLLAHNANSKSVAAEIQMMYPAAKVLYIDNLSRAAIDVRMRQIANDDWDAIVLPHSLIERLSFREETLMAMAQEEIEALEDEAELAAADDGAEMTAEMLDDPEQLKKLRSPTAKELVKARNRIIETIKKQAQQSSREGSVPFEDLGIDMVLVDEAHVFKKPPISTRMKMKGLQTQVSQASIQLNFLTRYIRDQNNGGNVHLFTGTPITNTLTEIFHQMRYIMAEEMATAGVDQWDGWFGSFAKEVQDVELTAAGEYEAVNRLRGFINVPELRKMIGQYMDVVFSDDMPEMQPRRTKSGKTLADPDLTERERAELLNGRTENATDRPYKKVINETSDPTPEQMRIFTEVQRLAAEWRQMSGKARKDAMAAGLPVVPIMYEGTAARASFDARMARDEELAGQEGKIEDDPNSKISRAIRNLVEIHNSDARATQVVFTNTGLGTTATRAVRDSIGATMRDADGKPIRHSVKVFSPIRDMVERLVQQGIPRAEIAIVDGSTSKEKRKEVADAMNAGTVRIVIGSTESLGVGVNMQRNLRAMHHLDAPWMPGDLEQRNGRGHRQGNQWNTVREYRYITDRIDGRRWQVLAIKQKFITDFLKADGKTRVIEGDAASDEESDILSTFAEAAGDPRVLLRQKLNTQLEQLRKRERLHTSGIADARRSAQRERSRLATTKAELDRIAKAGIVEAVQEAVTTNAGKAFRITIDGKQYDERGDAGLALEAWLAANLRSGARNVKVGTYAGHRLTASWHELATEPSLALTVAGERIESGRASIPSLEATLRNWPAGIDAMRGRAQAMEATIQRLDEVAQQPFQRADQLERVEQQVKRLDADMAANPVPPPAWLRSGAPVDTDVVWNGTPFTVTGHRWNADGWFVIAEDAQGGEVAIPYEQAQDTQGMALYEPRPFEAPVIHERKATEDADGAADLDMGDAAPLSRPVSARDEAITLRIARAVHDVTRTWGSNAPAVRVLRSAEELPAAAKRKRPGRYRSARGFYDGSTVWIVAPNTGTVEQALRTLAHEAVGHFGLDAIVDEHVKGGWARLEADIARLRADPSRANARIRSVLDSVEKRYRGEDGSPADPRTFAREFVAVMAERGLRNGPVDRVIAAVRAWLRKMFPGVRFGERDILRLLAASEDFIRTNNPTVDARRAAVAAMMFDKNGDPFYSALNQAVQTAKGAPKKADPAAWKQWLDGAQRRGEFKQAERQWMGLDAWLDAQDGQVTREQIGEFVRENQVQVQEVVLGGESSYDAFVRRMTEKYGDRWQSRINDREVAEMESLPEAEKVDTKFGEYQLPGGKNYRELLLTLPANDGGADRIAALSREELGRIYEQEIGYDPTEDDPSITTDALRAMVRELPAAAAAAGTSAPSVPTSNFHSPHFDQPNILAHVRFNERTDADGKRVLFVEEIQSDWHQAGRKRGYRTSEKPKPWTVFDENSGRAFASFETEAEANAELQRRGGREQGFLVARDDAYAPVGISGTDMVPDAPFKKEWPMLAFKRVLRYAAEHGFERVAWTTGEQQAERYDLSKKIGTLSAARLATGDYAISANGPRGADIPGFRNRRVPESKLAETVGKELADKIIAGEGGTLDSRTGARVYSGLDLKVGGEGMRAFYDRMLPNEVNKYAKAWGAKVGETTIKTPGHKAGGTQTAHSLDITPAMRESVLAGQAMFDAAPPQSTAAFRRWFRQSKATTAAGAPLTVYHGTGEDFAAFSEAQLGAATGHATAVLGYHFTTDRRLAERYAEKASEGRPADERVITANLSIQNPYEMTLAEAQALETPEAARAFREKLRAQGHDGIRIAEANTWIAFDATQVKSVFNRGTYDPADPRMDFDSPDLTIDAMDDVIREPDKGAFAALKRAAAGAWENMKPATLGALQLRHLLELMEDVKPLKGAHQYANLAQAMDTDRNQLMTGRPDAAENPDDMLAQGVAPLADKWRKWAYQKGLPGLAGRLTPEAQALNRVMHDSTIQGMDPSQAYQRLTMETARGDVIPWTPEEVKRRIAVIREQQLQRGGEDQSALREEVKYLRNLAKLERERERKWPALVARFQALSPEAQAIYKQTRDWYRQHSDAVEDALIGRIEAMDLPETYRRSMVDRLRMQFESVRRQGVYFPLGRTGDFWLSVTDANGESAFKMFESAHELERAERKLRKAGYIIEASGRRDTSYSANDAPPGTFVREVIDQLKKSRVPEKVQDEIYQVFLKTLPEMSMRKRHIHRKNVPGYSDDALRTFAKNGFHGAHQLARLRYSQQMQMVVEAMKASLDNYRQDAEGIEAAKADALLAELKKRHDWIMSPKDSQLANRMTSIGFLYFLGASPAAALVNLTQGAQVTLPVLAAQHGWNKASRAIAAATAAALRTGGNIQRTLTNENERRAYRVLEARGDIDRTQAHTLAALAEGDQLAANPTWTRVMNGVSWMFHKAEIVNREAAGIAAFRLATSAGKSFDEAVRYASEIINGTHFDYSAANRPRYLQNGAAKVIGQFKNYSVGMTWLMGRNLFQAFKGESPEVRRAARRTLVGILGTTSLLAGTVGLPIYNAVKFAFEAAHLAYGDDDEPWDFDTEFRQWLAEHFGDAGAAWIADGPANRLGADIASRVSLSNLWFRDADRELEGRDAYYNLLETIAGPMGGLTKNFYVGMERVRDGKVWRGVETMLPNFAKNAMKALRYEAEGVNSLRGDPIIEDPSAAESILQGLGFRPTRLAEQQRLNSALFTYQQHIQDRRRGLMNAYAMALHAQDETARRAVLEKIAAFNRKYPEIAVSTASLRKSLRARAAYSARAEGGIALNRRLAARVREEVGASP